MTHRENFIKALRCEPQQGRVPHFELVFMLTMELIGKVHPSHRNYTQWNQMESIEKNLHIKDMASVYIDIAKKYEHSAILVQPFLLDKYNCDLYDFDNTLKLLEEIRNQSSNEYFIMLHGDSTYPIPNGDDMVDFSIRMFEDEDKLLNEAEKKLNDKLHFAEKLNVTKGLVDGFALCSDYAFNTNPFYSNDQFSVFIAPYLEKLIKGYRDLDYFSIKHSDGNISPILKQIIQCRPDAIHSIDPQGGMSISKIRSEYKDICLIGNVNCGLLQTGSIEELKSDVRRSLQEGMSGGGYVFSTSNCVYTGLPLERYDLMHEIWLNEGIYK